MTAFMNYKWCQLIALGASVLAAAACSPREHDLRGRIYILGRVVDPDGTPAQDIGVLCAADKGSLVFHGCSDDEGAFALGPLPSGRYAVSALGQGMLAGSGEVLAQPEEGPVELKLKHGGMIRGRFVDYETRAALKARPVCIPAGTRTQYCSKVGCVHDFELDGLAPGCYDLIAFNEVDRFGVLEKSNWSPPRWSTSPSI